MQRVVGMHAYFLRENGNRRSSLLHCCISDVYFVSISFSCLIFNSFVSMHCLQRHRTAAMCDRDVFLTVRDADQFPRYRDVL
jgi:hypothetical protein